MTLDLLGPALRTVPGDGITMAARCWPGEGAPVIALHGITATSASFAGVAECIAGARPLVGLDLRGRGDTEAPDGPYGMAQHACDVVAAMDHLGIEKAVVVGHSMGGFVAAALAAQAPERVAAVLLVDGGLPLAPPPGVDLAVLLDVILGPQIARLERTFASTEEYFDYWRALPFFAGGRWNPWVEAYLANDLTGEPGALSAKTSAAAVRQDTLDTARTDVMRDRLRAIEAPAVLLRAPEGFAPADPPLYSDDLLAAEGALVPGLDIRTLTDVTHYTITMSYQGARIVADTILELAARVGL